MRSYRAIGGLTAAGLITALGLPIQAAAADATTLYVDNAVGAHCSDSGTGSQAQPYCTIQAAADAAQPGQTVQVSPDGTYRSQVTITHSGTQGQPITFSGGGVPAFNSNHAWIETGANQAHAFAVSGAHDIVIQGFDVSTSTNAIAITDSARVKIDNDEDVPDTESAASTVAVRVSGQSSDVTVSRNILWNRSPVVIDAGVQRTTVEGNDLDSGPTVGITAVGAPNTVVVNNTVRSTCGSGISLTGGSTGAVIENNIVTVSKLGNCPVGSPQVEIGVSADSAPQSRTDYNVVHPTTGGSAYNWSGTAYPTAAALHTATGQGAHDIDADVTFSVNDAPLAELTEGSPAIDSADPNAPGIQGTDVMGNPAADDPTVANSGATFRDRGAYEFEGLSHPSIIVQGATTPSPEGPAPLSTKLTVSAPDTWTTALSYSYDFGDGSPAVVSTSPTATHSYPTVGRYTPTVTVTDGLGSRAVASDRQVVVNTPGPLVPVLTATKLSSPLTFDFSTVGTTDPYWISNTVLDYGDGTQDHSQGQHAFPKAGKYTVTATFTDESGTTKSTSVQVDAEYDPAGFVPITPTRVMDTRNPMMGSHQPLVPGTPQYIITRAPAGATAVVLNLTATNANETGHLTVFPAGTSQPSTSNLNYTAGTNIANLVTVPLGTNGELEVTTNTGSVDAIADVYGYYVPGAAAKFTPTTPARILDTRNGGDAGKLGPAATLPLQITGQGSVPANATAVVLNLTTTEATDSSYLAAYPSGTAFTGTSNLNFQPGRNTPNQVIVPVGPDGKVTIYNHSGSVHVIADVFGYYSPDGKGLFTPVSPTRLLDTRDAGPAAKPGPGSVTSFGGLPAGATAAALNVTATGGDNDGFLTVFADGTPRPGSSNLNVVPNTDIANHAITQVGTDGKADVYNFTGHTDFVADLFGYFTNN
ncbi:right-handed parallel beta-helix repeat-containing protein [Kitasatospora mediocidica]|uniref:right-handed parallel beta-helix repeat-containing protein n=1 Tax=Kitasatospora mediocidica TaxID=58352 RepID=UPI00056A43CD|nr:right-handed parallel beta-helix repeat-containing protein [Kitasatospora mediocidica]